jgi:hypothetical protein
MVRTDAPASPLPRFDTVIENREKALTTRSGSGAATVQLRVSGWLVLPALSVARTANECDPGARPL